PIFQGKGSKSPLDISPDGKSLLFSRYNSATSVELFVLDIASGQARPVGPTDRKAAYVGGAFTGDGKGVVTLSDDGSDTARPVVFDLAGGGMRELAPASKWPAEDFDLSPD